MKWGYYERYSRESPLSDPALTDQRLPYKHIVILPCAAITDIYTYKRIDDIFTSN